MPPFMRQCWGLQVGPMHETAGMGKLINAVLLSLMRRVSVCCATLLLSQLVGAACVQARSSNPRGRACGPSGKGSGEKGILNGVVPVYLYCPAFNVSVSLGVYCRHAGYPATQHTSHRRPGPRWAVRADGIQRPTNMQPGTFCYRWLGSG